MKIANPLVLDALKKSTYLELGKLEIEDIINSAKELTKLPYVDGNRLAVHGWSFGGFMTTSLMLRNANVFKVGVAGGPVTDWKYYEVMYGERYMDTPAENPKGYEEASLQRVAGETLKEQQKYILKEYDKISNSNSQIITT